MRKCKILHHQSVNIGVNVKPGGSQVTACAQISLLSDLKLFMHKWGPLLARESAVFWMSQHEPDLKPPENAREPCKIWCKFWRVKPFYIKFT